MNKTPWEIVNEQMAVIRNGLMGLNESDKADVMAESLKEETV